MDKLPNVVPAGPQLSSQPKPRQISMTFDSAELQGMSAIQRANVIRHLASLFAQAAGVAPAKERDDDQR